MTYTAEVFVAGLYCYGMMLTGNCEDMEIMSLLLNEDEHSSNKLI